MTEPKHKVYPGVRVEPNPKNKVYPGARVEPKVQAKLGAWIINPNPEYSKVKNMFFI